MYKNVPLTYYSNRIVCINPVKYIFPKVNELDNREKSVRMHFKFQ